MEYSKLVVAMRDFCNDMTLGEMEKIAESKVILDTIETEFKRVAQILNDIDHLKNNMEKKE